MKKFLKYLLYLGLISIPMVIILGRLGLLGTGGVDPCRCLTDYYEWNFYADSPTYNPARPKESEKILAFRSSCIEVHMKKAGDTGTVYINYLNRLCNDQKATQYDAFIEEEPSEPVTNVPDEEIKKIIEGIQNRNSVKTVTEDEVLTDNIYEDEVLTDNIYDDEVIPEEIEMEKVEKETTIDISEYEEEVEIEEIEMEKVEEDVEVPFSVIENVPVFPGCENGNNEKKRKCTSERIAKFVQRKFNTDLAGDLGLSGRQRVNVIFKIDKTGNVIDVRARGSHPRIEKEAVRVISSLPTMQPGKQRGKVVIVPYSLPIIFQIQG